jgi:hypothetical protein
MEFVIAAIIFVALLACWLVLPAFPTTARPVEEAEGVALTTVSQNA